MSNSSLPLILVILFLFGILYNIFVSWLGQRADGYTSLLVVGGVLVTLAGVALIDYQAALLVVCTFIASGLPMIVGDIARHIIQQERKDREEQKLLQELNARTAQLLQEPVDGRTPEN